jgi:fucose permease
MMAFLILMTEGAMADWSAVYLRQSLRAEAALAGAGYAVFSMAMATGRLTGDRLVRSFGPATLLRVGGSVSACAMGIALLLHSPLAAMIGFGCVGLGLSNMIPITFSAAGRTPGVAPGTAIAAVSTTGYGGFLAGPPLLGFVANLSGLPCAMGLLALFMAVIALSARSFVTQSRASQVP